MECAATDRPDGGRRCSRDRQRDRVWVLSWDRLSRLTIAGLAASALSPFVPGGRRRCNTAGAANRIHWRRQPVRLARAEQARSHRGDPAPNHADCAGMADCVPVHTKECRASLALSLRTRNSPGASEVTRERQAEAVVCRAAYASAATAWAPPCLRSVVAFHGLAGCSGQASTVVR
jgi:hypothetical protein